MSDEPIVIRVTTTNPTLQKFAADYERVLNKTVPQDLIKRKIESLRPLFEAAVKDCFVYGTPIPEDWWIDKNDFYEPATR